MKSDRVVKILSVAVVVIIIGYLGINIYRSAESNYKTETAYVHTVSETADARFFIIREEEILKADKKGVVVSLAKSGGKVSNGSKIAAVFSNEEDAENYSESLSLKKKLEAYEKINSQARLANLDLGKLTGEIDSDFFSMLDAVYYNDYKSLAADEISFSENFSRKRISLGEEVDCSKQIAALKKQISKLTSVKPLGTVSATKAGFYAGHLDGFEKTLSFDKIDSLTPEKLEKALEADKSEVPENTVGKIINGFEWYAACVVPADELSGVEAGRNMSLMFGDSDPIAARLYIKRLTDDGKCLAVFKCSFMNETLAGLRKVTGKIVVRNYTGIRIRKDAIRFSNEDVRQKDGSLKKESVEGVYIKEGNLIKFNRIKELYSNDDFVVAEDRTGVPGWLAQYDEIVYSGKELENGKVID